MSEITDFYYGIGTDHSGRYLREYRDFTVDQLEQTHDYIQWMFPNMEASQYNPDAPLLTYDDIDAFMDDQLLQNAASVMAHDMYNFYMNNAQIWITPHNHNYLRITRIMKFLNAIELQHPMGCSEADRFFAMAVHFYAAYPQKIGKETLRFWLDASEYKA